MSQLLPTTSVLDVTDIQDVDVRSPEFKELIIRLVMNANQQNLAINSRDIGVYDVLETVTGQTYFPSPTGNSTRGVYRKCFDFGALPNNAVKPMLHGITLTPGLFFTKMFATSSDPVANIYLPIPYAIPALPAEFINLRVNGLNIEIATGMNRTMFTKTYVVLEYLKD